MTDTDIIDLRPLISLPMGAGLQGDTTVPGDKSISHRALILGAMAVGRSRIDGLLEGEDVMATARALQAMGVPIRQTGDGRWQVDGVGVGGMAEPTSVIDAGNSGTGARLLIGLAAGHAFTTFFTGDASLRSRPMARVMTPLAKMGAHFTARSDGRLPFAVTGAEQPAPICYRSPVASAQIKSAVLLMALNTPGRTTIVEPRESRDHTEIMLRHLGAMVTTDTTEDGENAVSLTGQCELRAADFVIPGDPSSAAFPLVAAAILPGSEVTIRNVGINPLRAGLLTCLQEMGAAIDIRQRAPIGGEPAADIVVRGGCLTGIVVPPERAPSMIDEYPILCVAAALAQGRTEMRGLSELRVKETDRIKAMVAGLAACGVAVEELPDGLIVTGAKKPKGGATVASHMDHRIAMSFLVLGLAAEAPITIDGGAIIDTSFPGFVALMTALGATIEEVAA